ncbi:acetolactate synthase I/II/III large subunit [Streptomyces albospinus]|uniref:Acetolactate synthase I/II/III large subunit n=1 Tax=Streptomyces albospinus TaxID=285515 RepID=A0ABQ2UXX0_9ACTN|nr:thiamine pyrophosphate-binding protein [Streptomyces albospinus]GGU59484.1 acetolactate synthase I/II/III large subunit [Streptomyces albospinus]
MTPQTYPSAWAAVADHLHHLGTGAVFGLPGDDMAPLAELERADTPVVLCRDQRNAVFMATGYALAAGRPGVCVIGKGPALTNALTGVLEARSAAAPLLLIADGTRLDRLGTGAFQELDQLTAVRPYVKWAARVDTPERLPATLEKAAALAVNGTPGPVYIELAEQLADRPVTRTGPWRNAAPQRLAPDPDALAATARRIAAARRPLLLVGGGARHRNTGRRIERLAERLGAGVFCTASGRGTVAEDHPLYCGVSGLYTVAPADALWREADLVIALGSRLEETATFGWPDAEAGELPVIQAVLGEDGLSMERPGAYVLGDAGRIVDGWTELLAGHETGTGWPDRVRAVRAGLARRAADRTAEAEKAAPEGTVPVARVLSSLDRAVPADRVLVQENGLQDMWSYYFPHGTLGAGGGSVVPSEQTPLGFGAAAAVGVRLAGPAGRPVVALVGDGAFHLFRAELPSVADARAAVLYVVLDNGGYGWLQSNLDRVSGEGSRFAFTVARPTGTEGLAAAYGLGYRRATDAGALDAALAAAWQEVAGGTASVVEVAVSLADTPPGMAGSAGDFPEREGAEEDPGGG